MKKRILIISDLHVGAGQLDDCDSELEECIVSFLEKYSKALDPIELVINGDFLDFVQAEPWEVGGLESISIEGFPLCFAEAQSIKKFDAIAIAHAPIFRALGHFLNACEENSLVVMPGNHDADMFWPGIRARFEDAVCGQIAGLRERLRFHLELFYRPPSCPQVRIEHGHQYDPVNSFFVETDQIDPVAGYKVKKPVWSANNPPIFKNDAGEERLYECIGTRFLIRFMNKLDEKYPFVDNVKPFSRFIRIFGVSAFKPGFGPLRAAVSVWQMLSYVAREGITSPSSLLSLEKAGANFGPSALLQHFIEDMTDDEKKAFVRSLKERGYTELYGTLGMHVKDPDRAGSLMDFLSLHMNLIDQLEAPDYSLLSIDGVPGTLSMGKAFFVDETIELKKAALSLVGKNGVSHVIMGHTHEPIDKPGYVNTGCWTRYFRFGDDGDIHSWKVLDKDSYKLFPYTLRFAEIVPGNNPLVQSDTFKEKNHDTTD